MLLFLLISFILVPVIVQQVRDFQAVQRVQRRTQDQHEHEGPAIHNVAGDGTPGRSTGRPAKAKKSTPSPKSLPPKTPTTRPPASMASASADPPEVPLSASPFRRRIMADVYFNVRSVREANGTGDILSAANGTTVAGAVVVTTTVSVTIGPTGSSSSSTTPASERLFSLDPLNSTRVKDLRPPPPVPMLPSSTPAPVLQVSPPTMTAAAGMPQSVVMVSSTTTAAPPVTSSPAPIQSSTSHPSGSTKGTPLASSRTSLLAVKPSLLSRAALDPGWSETLNASSPECQRQLDKTDACFRTVMFMDANLTVPRTFAEIDAQFCYKGGVGGSNSSRISSSGSSKSSGSNGLVKCLGGYARCLTKIPRILYHFIYLQVKKLLTDACRDDGFREDILFHGRCFQSPRDLEVVRSIVDRGSLVTMYVLRRVPTQEIIPWGKLTVAEISLLVKLIHPSLFPSPSPSVCTGCCGFQKTLAEGIRQLDKLCWQRTGNQTGAFVMGFLRSAAADLLDIGCRRFNSEHLCSANLPEAMATFDALAPPEQEVPRQRYSPILPLIEISRRMSAVGE